MQYKKESLEKLLILIDVISKKDENEWFRNKLISKYCINNNLVENPVIEEIYEYCIKQIIAQQADKFYQDFKLDTIKDRLISDFIRMENFRRMDNFEDFCMALFQQIEGITNELATSEVKSIIEKDQNKGTHKIKDRETMEYVPQKLWQLVFNPNLKDEELQKKLSKPIHEWDFTERFKSILYVFFFNHKIYNYQDFLNIFFLGNELYQSRNLNHRGGTLSEKQKKTVEKVTSNSYKYYFKFLGFFEDFTTKINSNL